MELWERLKQERQDKREHKKEKRNRKSLRRQSQNNRNREQRRKERKERRERARRTHLSKEERRKCREKRGVIETAPNSRVILNYFKRENLKNKTSSEMGFETLLKRVQDEKYPQLMYEPQKIWEYPWQWGIYYIIDFYVSFPQKIAFEIDGKYHENQQAKDKLRDKRMMQCGLMVVRFRNYDIRYRFDWVFEQVVKLMGSLNPPA